MNDWKIASLGLIAGGSAANLSLGARDQQYSIEFSKHHGLVVLSQDELAVLVGCRQKPNKAIMEMLRSYHDRVVEFKVLGEAGFSQALAAAWGTGGSVPSSTELKDSGRNGNKQSQAASRNFEDLDNPSRVFGENLALDSIAEQAPIINLVNGILLQAIDRRASDVHIEALPDGARVRMRIDGAMHLTHTLSRAQFLPLASRIKVMAQLNILEQRLSQDGRMSVDCAGQRRDVRVSIVPLACGESLVLRLLGVQGMEASLEQLCMPADLEQAARKLVEHPQGLVVVAGPTGSGKTTTLSALLRCLDASKLKIMTLEDPVEMVLPGVSQIPVNEDVGNSFAALLRRILRQDPDVIMVGEIRDRETAELAIRAALTGHLVLSTLHTSDAVGIITRLRNLGIDAYLIAAVLRLALSQRLLRRLCPACRESRPAQAAEHRMIARELNPRSQGLKNPLVYEACSTKGSEAEGQVQANQSLRSCPCCEGRGWLGRIAVFEGFAVDEQLEETLSTDAGGSRLRNILKERGMRSLSSHALERALQGDTSLAEIQSELGL